jgi:hypothetical protein
MLHPGTSEVVESANSSQNIGKVSIAIAMHRKSGEFIWHMFVVLDWHFQSLPSHV